MNTPIGWNSSRLLAILVGDCLALRDGETGELLARLRGTTEIKVFADALATLTGDDQCHTTYTCGGTRIVFSSGGPDIITLDINSHPPVTAVLHDLTDLANALYDRSGSQTTGKIGTNETLEAHKDGTITFCPDESDCLYLSVTLTGKQAASVAQIMFQLAESGCRLREPFGARLKGADGLSLKIAQGDSQEWAEVSVINDGEDLTTVYTPFNLFTVARRIVKLLGPEAP